MNKPLTIRSVLLTLVLLPTSCVAGSMAAERAALRLDGHIVYDGPLWYENVLWLTALGLMLVWAWAIKRLWGGEK
ncbi:hypothetical protein [Erythrobacter sp. EC-HK427]|uniref:hypothetical protein n=1 Tax=Erythrobacter sp. EC-HK427 TaxID=2038396 RepID=UPI001254BCEF|nr:hypothetical protein [Erythrobacter sp. EC-HK427]VVT06349.1 conserved exported hypothetical protein [Erythrobacter sp. EC-HK427]